MNHSEDRRDDPDHDGEQLKGSGLVALRRNIVRAIRVEFEPQKELEVALDELLASAAGSRHLQQAGVRLLAPSYSGKSTAAKEYCHKIIASAAYPGSELPVIYVKLDSEGTVSSLATDLLRAMDQTRPDSLTPAKRWERVRRVLRESGVLLIIFDEFQRAGRRPTVHPLIAGKIMDLMDDKDWPCACAFVGKTDAKSIFKASFDLGNRLDAPVDMGQLLWADEGHRAMFIKFAGDFDQALVDHGATRVKAGLDDPAIAELLLESSNGLIGQFSRIVETAVMAITRRGQDGIIRDDLEEAVDEWAIGNERIGYNPFRKKSS